MIRRLLLLLLLLLPLHAAAQAPAGQMLAGSWGLRADGPVVFRFDLVREGDSWRGSWWRPKSFSTDGNRFTNLADQSVEIKASEGKSIGEWAELTFPDNRPGAVPDVFRFRLTGPGKVEMLYVDTGLAPFTLERVSADTLLGPWEPGKVYRRAGAPPANARLRATARPQPETQGPPAFEGR